MAQVYLKKKNEEVPIFTQEMIMKSFNDLIKQYVKPNDVIALFEKYLTSLHNSNKRAFEKIEKANDISNKAIMSNLKALRKEKEEFSNKVDGFEESLLYIMHNIKKNQFLYAHYPEDWVNEYLDIKAGLKHENEFMDKQVANAN